MSRFDNPELGLALTAMGIPFWLDYFSGFNKILGFLLYLFSIFVSFTSSFWHGVTYAAIFAIGRAAILGAGFTITQNTDSPTPFIVSVILCTGLMLAYNCAVATHYLGVWSF